MHGPKDERTADELAKLGYERADIGLRAIAIWVFGFFAFAVIAGVITAGIYHFLVPEGLGFRETTASRQAHEVPAAPRLQDDVRVKTDIYDLRRYEHELLHGSEGYRPISEVMDEWAQTHGDGGHAEPEHSEPAQLSPGEPAYGTTNTAHEGAEH